MAEELFFILITSPWFDLKKAISICTKASTETPPQYNMTQTEISYRREREMYLADTLSRVYQSLNPTDKQISETEREVESSHDIDYLAISVHQLNEIKQETAKDPNLRILKMVIVRGFPEKSSSVPKDCLRVLQCRRRTGRIRRNRL